MTTSEASKIGIRPFEQKPYSIDISRLRVFYTGKKEVESHFPFSPEGDQLQVLHQWHGAYDLLMALVSGKDTSLHSLDAIESVVTAGIKTHAGRRNKTDIVVASEERQRELYNAYLSYNASFLPQAQQPPPRYPSFADYWHIVYSLEDHLSLLPSKALLTFPAIGRHLKAMWPSSLSKTVSLSKK